MARNKKVPNTKQIKSFLHCALCIDDVMRLQEENGVGFVIPQEYARYEFGWTVRGLQAWCVRHDCNIIHIDFEGARHKANMTRVK